MDVPATLAAPDQPELTEAQSRELERRLAAHEMSPDDVISWERVKVEAQARTRR